MRIYPELPQNWQPYDKREDYCGPEGRWYSKILSRYILGIDCNEAYWAHDNRYRLGKTEADRLEADKAMLRDQITLIRAATHPTSPRRYIAMLWALRRYHMVHWFGKRAFWKGKVK